MASNVGFYIPNTLFIKSDLNGKDYTQMILTSYFMGADNVS